MVSQSSSRITVTMPRALSMAKNWERGLEGVETLPPAPGQGPYATNKMGVPTGVFWGETKQIKGELELRAAASISDYSPKPINHVPPANQTCGFAIFILKGFTGI